MTNNKEFFGTEPIKKLLFKLAVPTVVAQLVNMLYNIIDRVYIGHMPENSALALTGVDVCMPLILLVAAFAAIVSSGGAPCASINMGWGSTCYDYFTSNFLHLVSKVSLWKRNSSTINCFFRHHS